MVQMEGAKCIKIGGPTGAKGDRTGLAHLGIGSALHFLSVKILQP
jgi:hypothetical protein